MSAALPLVVVTGAAGFLGRHVCPALDSRYRVARLVSPRRAGDAARDVYALDLADPAAVAAFADAAGFGPVHALVHMAAALPGAGRERDPAVYDANAALTRGALALARALRPAWLVNFSSLAVYPVRDGVFDEDGPIDPAANTEGFYGLAKFEAEMLLRLLAPAGTGVVNLRLAQAYGPGQGDNLLVAVLARELAEKNTITLFGEGERVSNFIHADDVAEALLAVLAAPRAGTYNLGCAENTSYVALAHALVAARGRPDARVILEPRGIRAKCAIDTSKFQKTYSLLLKKCDFSW
ncbi:NAD-dependent epimerase/dehydratase family protein [Solidesulfovibrio alcoholivorans]|uniref:NAD-dependent epimerase/dehydratase family protein n=1 Tax=Solidesulfovibrio alcoholivorans TaxID=81406 RepID=UPI0004973D38|nr:NAD(P)-dependent oxidoreductase [Solidesulfovibrio alcoholivorans]